MACLFCVWTEIQMKTTIECLLPKGQVVQHNEPAAAEGAGLSRVT